MGNVINNAGRTRETKYRVSLSKAAFNKEEALFNSKLDLNIRKKTSENYI
jgi:hypothetical protein